MVYFSATMLYHGEKSYNWIRWWWCQLCIRPTR